MDIAKLRELADRLQDSVTSLKQEKSYLEQKSEPSWDSNNIIGEPSSASRF